MPSSLVKATGQTAPQPVTGLALIDTGASKTTVAEQAIQKLNVSPVGTTQIWTPSGNAQQLLYPADMVFVGMPDRMTFATVCGSPHLANQNLLALIGRDILRHMVLVYNGPLGSFTLAM